MMRFQVELCSGSYNRFGCKLCGNKEHVKPCKAPRHVNSGCITLV